jgi:hypothetical protein
MALYKVLERSFINNMACEEGATVEYDGEPGANLEPVDEPAKKAAKATADKGVATGIGTDPVTIVGA